MENYIAYHTNGSEFCYIPVDKFFYKLFTNKTFIDLSEFEENIAFDICKKADNISISAQIIKYPINIIGTLIWNNYNIPKDPIKLAIEQQNILENLLKKKKKFQNKCYT